MALRIRKKILSSHFLWSPCRFEKRNKNCFWYHTIDYVDTHLSYVSNIEYFEKNNQLRQLILATGKHTA